MALDFHAIGHKMWRTIVSIQTGMVRFILFVIFAAACLARDLNLRLEGGERI